MKNTSLPLFIGTILCAIGIVLLLANCIHPLPHIGLKGAIIFGIGLLINTVCFFIDYWHHLMK